MTGMVNTKKQGHDRLLPDEPALDRTRPSRPTRSATRAYPASQQELVDFAGYGSKLFHCPDPNGGEYIYIAGHRSDDSAPSVVVYESKPVHNGKCNVLFSDGQIVPLAPEELQQALEATQARRP